MLQKVRERIHTLPEGRHCGIVFITGTVLFLIFNAVSLVILRRSGIYFDYDKDYLVGLYPVSLGLIACLLDEDLIHTVAACIGASVVLAVSYYRGGFVSSAVSIAAIFAINGYCLYYGRKGGWKGTIFRTLSLFPTFFFVFCILWDGGSIAEKRYAAVLFILGLFCYYLMGKKNSWTTMDVIRGFIVIIPATFLLMFPALYLFIIFCPGYDP